MWLCASTFSRRKEQGELYTSFSKHVRHLMHAREVFHSLDHPFIFHSIAETLNKAHNLLLHSLQLPHGWSSSLSQ